MDRTARGAKIVVSANFPARTLLIIKDNGACAFILRPGACAENNKP